METAFKIRAEGIVKLFPGVRALNNIDFAVKKGTVHVLVGENGAGKSTLMKIFNGLYRPDSGQIYIDEKPVKIQSPIHARHYGIAMIAQELNYVPEMSVEENLFLGRLPVTKAGNVDWRKIRKETIRLLHEENLPYTPEQKMKTLTVSDIQMLEIIKAISYNADIIVMDEPTSAITQREVEILFKKIEHGSIPEFPVETVDVVVLRGRFGSVEASVPSICALTVSGLRAGITV
jgi:inositol transport system ATP-binding protein